MLAGYISYDDLSPELQELIDNSGGVIKKDFNVITALSPAVQWYDDSYPEGESVFALYYDPTRTSDNISPLWMIELDSLVPEGEIKVTTYKNTSDGIAMQMIEAANRGAFGGLYLRTMNPLTQMWNASSELKYATTVNGIYPDGTGNIQLDLYSPTGEFITEEALFDTNMRNTGEYIVTQPEGNELPSTSQVYVRVTMIDTGMDGYYGKVYQVIELNTPPTSNNYYIRMDTLIDEAPYVYEDEWKLVGSSNANPISIIDNLTSLSTTDALSAHMGRELANMIDNVSTLLSRHVQTDMATNTIAGHVKPDGVTIVVDTKGVISAVNSSGNIEWKSF